jgi:hypothetical protein
MTPKACLLLVGLGLAFVLTACSNYTTLGAGPAGVKVPTQPPGSKSLPAKTKAGQSIQRQPTPGKDAVFCRLSDLTPTATWTVSEQGLIGSLTLTNYWPVACLLRGQPQLGLTDDNGQEFPLQLAAPTPSPDPPTWQLKQNTVGEVRFKWSNWCGPRPNGAMRVTVSMPNQNEPTLYVVVQDENGNPLGNFPACTDGKKLSSLVEEPLQLK